MASSPPPPGAPPRRTVAAAFALSGVGVHTGERATAEVRPAPFGAGIAFRVGDVEIPARIDHVVGAAGSTTLGLGGARVGMVEHLLAALAGCGVTDAVVAVTGPEVPILDGSAAPWCRDVARVGLVEGPPAEVVVVGEPIRVEGDGGWAVAVPHEGCVLAVDVDFPDGPRGRVEASLDRFVDEVSWARTFALERDVARLLGMGRGRGASEANTVVWGPDGPRLPARSPDEPVRHKLLDLVGDLALLGAPWRCAVEVHRGGHALHHRLCRALAALRA